MWPRPENLPAVHGVMTPVLWSQLEPAGHARQLVSPSGERKPVGQSTIPEESRVKQALFKGHFVQLVASKSLISPLAQKVAAEVVQLIPTGQGKQ